LYKKLFAAGQNRPDVAEARAHWHKRMASHSIDRLVFVDESGTDTKMTRFRGWERPRAIRRGAD
jgi:hypothetical protein